MRQFVSEIVTDDIRSWIKYNDTYWPSVVFQSTRIGLVKGGVSYSFLRTSA